ncbi:C6 finger domain protein [Fusarium beomiforme]|uniref:alcohol dehydrogenase (NADP(+)) n=1 Tax=Fusarium beomiforme TaxID=44412 RepID=A0A9P5ADS1_9HYPO|nr:C6 finger domain protein [Fusarium beomiforme]
MYPETFDGFAIPSASEWDSPKRITFKPKAFGEYDIDVKIVACGVCGSDVHTTTGGWGNKTWPLVPGHEIIGYAVRVGAKVTSVKVGDRVGVGAQISACLDCPTCKDGNETYCKEQMDTYGSVYPDGTVAHGGYSSHIRAHEHFTFPIPEELETELAAPMLCAGLTAYSPLVRNGAGPGKKVGIVGIGGIGHFGILFSKALGAETYAISRSSSKKDDALAMGADGFLETRIEGWSKEHEMTFDLILSTASSNDDFDLAPYLSLLKVHGRFIAVGLPEGEGWRVSPQSLLANGCLIGSSHLGSREETLAMLELAAKQGIKSWVETIPISEKGCGEARVDCQYDDGPSQRIDTSGGTKEIISRLKDIKDILAEQQQQLTVLSSLNASHPASRVGLAHGVMSNTSDGSPSSVSMHGTQPIDNDSPQFATHMRKQSDADASEPMNIPAEHKTSSSYLLGLPAVKMLVGEYPTNLFFLLESQSPLPPELSPEQCQTSLPPFQIDRPFLDHLVASFFSSVHVSHPVLDQAEFTIIYERFLDKGADSSTESALCMTVFALGAVSSLPTGSSDTQSSPAGTEYIKYALPTLMLRSLWLFSFDLALAQALVLASVYFAYIVRPLHSWRLIYLATNLLQLKLSSSMGCQKQALNTEVDILRLFWSCFIIECDRLAELELPRSSLQQLTDDANLPRCENLDDIHMTAYLAEISIRRLLNRIHNSLYPRKPNALNTSLSSTSLMTPEEFSIDELTSITSVCEELHSQLDLWHAAIPEQFRPPLNLEDIDNDRISILRIRYYAARHIIYRPFVLHVTTHNNSQIPSAVIEKAGICIESCSLYLYHTSKILRAPSQYTWTFALSSLGAVIILTLSWLNPKLRFFVPEVDSFQSMAIDNLSRWNVSSISDVLAILEEIRRKTRLRSRV